MKTSALLLFLALLLLPMTAGARCLKKGPCVDVDTPMIKVVSDGTISVAGAAQAMSSWCFADAVVNAAVYNATFVCVVPQGWTAVIRKIEYNVRAALSTSEQCRIGLSVDATAAPNDFEAWSATDVGASTTQSCDSQPVVTVMDSVGDVCVNEDATGTTVTEGDIFYLLVDEADSGTPTCTSLTAILVTLFVEWFEA